VCTSAELVRSRQSCAAQELGLAELEAIGGGQFETILHCGDVLYLPRGSPHATRTTTSTLNAEGARAETTIERSIEVEHAPLEATGGAHVLYQSDDHHRQAGVGSSTVSHASPFTNFSTSLTLSLLSETIALTSDKLLRCLVGVGSRCHAGATCAAAADVLDATAMMVELRRTLPVGFLANALVTGRHSPSQRQPWEVLAAMPGEVTEEAEMREDSIAHSVTGGRRRIAVNSQGHATATAVAGNEKLKIDGAARETWLNATLLLVQRLASSVPAGYSLQNAAPRAFHQKTLVGALPRRQQQMRILKHISQALHRALHSRSVALEAIEGAGGESDLGARAATEITPQAFETLHTHIWPAACRVFVEPAR